MYKTIYEAMVKQSIEDQNTAYIKEHVANVKKGYEWIKTNLPEILNGCDMNKLANQISKHDESKWSKEEFKPYAEHFFGSMKGKKEDPAFDKAWRHHYENNPHHPQYWKGAEMTPECIVEMICDWWSFSWKKDKLDEIFAYYKNDTANDPEKALGSETKKIVEEDLNKLQQKLIELKLIKKED